jgi:hypothetical protein
MVKTPEAAIPFDRDYAQQFFFGDLISPNKKPVNASVADYYKAASLGKLRIEDNA